MLYAKLRSKLLCVCTYVGVNVQVDVPHFRPFNAAYEGSVLRVFVKALYIGTYIRTCWVSPFSAQIRTEFLSKFFSMRNCAENHGGIRQKIRACLHGYLRPPALQNRGICRENVSYLCQVPYINQCKLACGLCVCKISVNRIFFRQ